MTFNFGGQYGREAGQGSGFSFKPGGVTEPPAEDPFESVEYTGDLQVDSIREMRALIAAMEAAPPEYLVGFVFPDRAALEDFMRRRHLQKKNRYFQEKPVRRGFDAAPAGAAFNKGAGGFSLKQAKAEQEVNADAGWVDRVKNEVNRFKQATDSEYYIIVQFDSEDARAAFLADYGLDQVERLPIEAGVFLSGPAADRVLS